LLRFVGCICERRRDTGKQPAFRHQRSEVRGQIQRSEVIRRRSEVGGQKKQHPSIHYSHTKPPRHRDIFLWVLHAPIFIFVPLCLSVSQSFCSIFSTTLWLLWSAPISRLPCPIRLTILTQSHRATKIFFLRGLMFTYMFFFVPLCLSVSHGFCSSNIEHPATCMYPRLRFA